MELLFASLQQRVLYTIIFENITIKATEKI